MYRHLQFTLVLHLMLLFCLVMHQLLGMNIHKWKQIKNKSNIYWPKIENFHGLIPMWEKEREMFN